MAITNDTIGIYGHGLVEVHDAKTGALLRSERYTNIITDYVREALVGAFTGASVDVDVTHVAIGTDGTAATSADTALGAEVLRATPTSMVNYSAVSVGFKLFVSSSQANGDTLREIGLFDAASDGNMMARSVSFMPIVKSSSITVTFTHIISWS